ncbi:TPA: DUF2335 domain-containing protein [Serratia marcescens]|nr:DUF2335 domain-containing protein [Serratia marcescens]
MNQMKEEGSSRHSQQDSLEEEVEDAQEAAIAEIVTDVIKSEPELLQRIMEDQEVRELVMVQQMSYRGPLPPVELLSGYEQFCAGSTDRFIKQLEVNQLHQHSIEHAAMSAAVEKDKENRKYAFHLTLAALGSSVLLGLFGHDWLAGTIATTTIGTILITFILNKKPGKDANKEEDAHRKAPPSAPAAHNDQDG